MVEAGADAHGATVGQVFGRWFLSSPLYGLTLPRRIPTDLRQPLRDPWPGSISRGETLLDPEHPIGLTLSRRTLTDDQSDPVWRAYAHGFSWLRDLRTLGGDDARRRGRELMSRWMEAHARWHPVAWQPDIMGARLAAWLGNWDFFAASADDAFRERLLASITRQACHLGRNVTRGPDGSGRLRALHGMIATIATLPNGERRMPQALRLIERELAHQILPDGAHVERSPIVQLDVLRRLVEMRNIIRAGGRTTPGIDEAVGRLAAMLRFLRHGDNGLSLFNGSEEVGAEAIEAVLAQADAKGRPGGSAPHAGFERLLAGRTLIIADAGPPAPPGLDQLAHAGTLAFEMSIGRERLIVNCGAADGERAAERYAYRGTAAHSTLSLDETNSSELLAGGGLGRQPVEVGCVRREEGGDLWLDLSHDGYRANYGAIHRRRLFLRRSGDDLRGEDSVEGGAGRRFTIRFHLHPRVQASLIQEGAAVLMRLPSGAGWRFRATGGRLGLSDSQYLGDRGVPKRTEQIVIEGECGDDGAQVKWALQAVPKR